MDPNEPTVAVERESRATPQTKRVTQRGAMVGRYRLIEEIGAGGMGVVHRAHDPDLDRDIAIKLVELRGDREAALAEAKSAAAITHPNIVAVHDVGWHRRQLYIAMELVEGETLADWLAAETRSSDEILELFRQVGRGLAAAHEAGVSHRDIKPANILVANERARIADFGIAARDGVAAVDAAGTPRYMAPEQRRGGGDAKSDQFSFCITLGEAAETAGATLPRRAEVAIARGSKADPKERWGSMSELVSELAEPRRIAPTLIAAAAVVVAVAMVLVMGQSSESRCDKAGDEIAATWNDDRRGAVLAALSGNDRSYAETTAKRAVAGIDAYASSWSAMQQASCRATHERGVQSSHMLDRRSRCLAKRRDELAAVLDALTIGTKAVDRAVVAVDGLSSLDACADAVALAGAFPTPNDDDRAVVADVEAKLAEANAALAIGDYERGRDVAGAALEAAQKVGYAPTKVAALLTHGKALHHLKEVAAGKRLREAAAEAARLGDSRAEVQAWLLLAGHLIDDRRQLKEARGVLTGLEAAVARSGARSADVGAMLTWRALLERRLGEREAASASYQAAIEALGEAGQPLLLAGALAGHSDFLALTSQFDAAEKELEKAEAIFLRELGRDHPRLLALYENAGLLYGDFGDYERSEDYLRRVLDANRARFGERSARSAHAAANLARTLAYRGKLDEARELYADALAIQQAELGDHLSVAVTLQDMAVMVLTRPQDRDQALRQYQKALAIRRAELGEEHIDVGRTLFNLGLWHVDFTRDENAAIRNFDRAQRIFEKTSGPNSPEVAFCLTARGESLIALGKPASAIEGLERALAIRTERSVAGLLLGETELALATALRAARRDPARAIELARSARTRFAAIDRADKVKTVDTWLGSK